MAAGAPLYAEDTVVGRRADADEIAAVVDFLASPNASYITGSDTIVDGGALSMYSHHQRDEVRRWWADATIEEPPTPPG
jgi:enoyl-[acyl-carrier-protein] reductase (NADH)